MIGLGIYFLCLTELAQGIDCGLGTIYDGLSQALSADI